ncbi:carbon starvation protein A [Candidatus Methanomassiliicoccus intestinalis]|uniref:carbon starvation protein A n=1 Tax=Candidatus Methanomassiliicoccus intestinalis TaxID=1406512 RepID=UPI0037DCAA9E
MNSAYILIAGIIILFIGYITYGGWLAKKWDVNDKNITPAHTQQDGVDYVPSKAPILLGHHFASIAGAGPINGPIQAAIFGWLPVFLWIVIGGIFFGAVQDFSSILASIRHKGRSIGYVISEHIGSRAKKLFFIFAYLTLLLVVAAFASIVIDTFDGFTVTDGVTTTIAANGSTAMASMLFIFVSIIFGIFLYRYKTNLLITTIFGVIAIIACIAVGLYYPLYLNGTAWTVIIFVYVFIASVAPVWILLQPRDYLNSFLLYGMMIAAFIGILFTGTQMTLPAYTGFGGITGSSQLFPMLFITVACGAISGFHSLVGSGTTSKQLNREHDAKLIGYGGMLIECVLAIIALIAVGTLFSQGAMPSGTPTQVFAAGIANMVAAMGIPQYYDVAYIVLILAISAFALTSLDTATRLARYMFQEFFADEGIPAKARKLLTNPYFSTLVTVGLGALLATGGYENIWPLFGSANQLLAVLALMAVAAWMTHEGKSNKMFLVPMAFMLVASISALCITFYNNIMKLFVLGTGTFVAEGLQLVIIVILIIFSIVLVIDGINALKAHRQKGREDQADPGNNSA